MIYIYEYNKPNPIDIWDDGQLKLSGNKLDHDEVINMYNNGYYYTSEKNKSTKNKISISKSELVKVVNVGAKSGEPGYAFIPTVHDQKYEDETAKLMSDLLKKSQEELEKEIKRFYNL